MLTQNQQKALKELMPEEFWNANYEGNQKIINACFNLGIKNPDDIVKIIEFINIEAINLFLMKIINEFTPEQQKAYEAYVETNPTPVEAISTLAEGYKQKYKIPVKDAVLSIREQFLHNFFTNLAISSATYQQIQALSENQRQELLNHLKHGNLLSFMLTLIEPENVG